MAVGILTTILSGLIISIFSFFSTEFPRTKNRIQINTNKLESQEAYLKNVERKIEKIDDKTQRILEHLLNEKRSK